MKKITALLFLFIAITAFGQKNTNKDFKITKKWKSLLDQELSDWESFIGVPHTSVDIDHPKSENVHKGTPLGLNNDPKNVFTLIEENGDLVLQVSGEIYGGLTTLQEFGDYHLKVKFKWGEKKWEPRLTKKRDNGILYHAHGKHGAFWNVWMSSLECQIQEGDTGDFVSLVKARADVNSTRLNKNLFKITGNDQKIIYGGGNGNPGYCHIQAPNENPNGEWNTIEVICVGDKSMHVVNGKVLMVVNNARRMKDGKEIPLVSGKIQLQSEGAEAYYKDIQIKKVKDFPKEYKQQALAFGVKEDIVNELPSLKDKKIIMIYGGWKGHQPKVFTDRVSAWLKTQGAIATIYDSLDVYTDKKVMSETDLIVQYWTMGKITKEQEKGLLEAVKNGTGIAGCHGGLGDSFRNNTEYQYMIGGQWVAHPGGKIDYKVTITDKEDPITKGLEDFDIWKTEQYYMHIDPNSKVLATTTFSDAHNDWIKGAVMPVSWKKHYDKGRIFYLSIGHDPNDFNTPSAWKLLTRGLRWASGSKYETKEHTVRPVYPSGNKND